MSIQTYLRLMGCCFIAMAAWNLVVAPNFPSRQPMLIIDAIAIGTHLMVLRSFLRKENKQ